MTLRVVFVSRRFWPLFGDAEDAVAELAVGVQSRGLEATILTARWDKRWSDQLVYRSVPVIRLPSPRIPGWGNRRYQSALSRWLRVHQDSYDVVCVSRMRFCAATAVDVARKTHKPVVLRVHESGPEGDCACQTRSRQGRRVAVGCRQADAFVVHQAAARQEMVEHDYPSARIHTITEGILPASFPNGSTKLDARRALAKINRDLTVSNDAPVVLSAGRLSENRGLRTLLAAWPAVRRRIPTARLWVLGDGPFRNELYQLKKELAAGHSVHLPGTFDDLSDALRAADVFVDPSADGPIPQSVLKAVTAELPIVIVGGDDKLHGQEALQARHVLRVQQNDAAALARSITDWIEHPPSHATLSDARARVTRHFALKDMVDQFITLFESLA